VFLQSPSVSSFSEGFPLFLMFQVVPDFSRHVGDVLIGGDLLSGGEIFLQGRIVLGKQETSATGNFKIPSLDLQKIPFHRGIAQIEVDLTGAEDGEHLGKIYPSLSPSPAPEVDSDAFSFKFLNDSFSSSVGLSHKGDVIAVRSLHRMIEKVVHPPLRAQNLGESEFCIFLRGLRIGGAHPVIQGSPKTGKGVESPVVVRKPPYGGNTQILGDPLQGVSPDFIVVQ
jgi:hypothetical protein